MKQIVCFGDSITGGRYGIGFTRYLSMPLSVHGIDGDTLPNILNRCTTWLKKPRPNSSCIVIEGGANDLLIPEMSRTNSNWESLGTRVRMSGASPVERLDQFVEQIDTSLRELVARGKNLPVIVCSIPPLGERLDSQLNRRRTLVNQALRQIAIAHDCIWCDIGAALEALIKQTCVRLGWEQASGYLPGSPDSMQEDVAYIRGDESRAHILSEHRLLVSTVDGLHPNALGARLIAEIIERCIPIF